jgi:hypothetical protein
LDQFSLHHSYSWTNWSNLHFLLLAKKKPNPEGSGYEWQIIFRNGAAILFRFPVISGIIFLTKVPRFHREEMVA